MLLDDYRKGGTKHDSTACVVIRQNKEIQVRITSFYSFKDKMFNQIRHTLLRGSGLGECMRPNIRVLEHLKYKINDG